MQSVTTEVSLVSHSLQREAWAAVAYALHVWRFWEVKARRRKVQHQQSDVTRVSVVILSRVVSVDREDHPLSVSLALHAALRTTLAVRRQTSGLHDRTSTVDVDGLWSLWDPGRTTCIQQLCWRSRSTSWRAFYVGSAREVSSFRHSDAVSVQISHPCRRTVMIQAMSTSGI